MRPMTEIARDMAECADAWDGCVRLIGNVKAEEIAALARRYLEADAAIAKLRDMPAELNEHASRLLARGRAEDDQWKVGRADQARICAANIAAAMAGPEGGE